MIVKILGTGCPKCKKLETAARQAIATMGLDATVEKVSDVDEIMDYGVIMTPALVIDEQVVSTGKVLSTEDIQKLLSKVL